MQGVIVADIGASVEEMPYSQREEYMLWRIQALEHFLRCSGRYSGLPPEAVDGMLERIALLRPLH